MSACIQLDIGFIWVDRFCITQDDEASKLGQIQRMGDIYASAVVTIVAASGTDAWAGLPGVLTDRPRVQQKLVLEPVEFIEYFEAFRGVGRSEWKTRGWTYQEAVLSPALLYFADDGICFECQHDHDALKTEGPNHHPLRPMFHAAGKSEYARAVDEYSHRTLGYDSDMLSAFSGFLHQFYGEDHCGGLLRDAFDCAIDWRPGPSEVSSIK
ncbi:HET-domain-containing protein [Neofusicoccum parvum]|uniref:Putative tol protein n=1 Tax=Botryosphaeria parva (strain UCR-NP2) TaxID=1287680 RepID=R1EVD9_BOTPV|nr:putative tol protein [Neofusicoccum parvum UCRNP2]GME55379.1 HET-domain-containing protein [Neofusicoccum parvum]